VIEMLAPKPPAAVVIESSMPTLRTERVALQQVLMNLIGNALKHAERPDAEIRVEARDAGDAHEFRVRDNGPGIAPEFHDRIWGIFQTLQPRDKVESTGIGLAIVKKIVEAQGGRVAIESALGEGATFLFTWPKHDDRRA
jgi:signal transduction histidine kinase